MTRDDVHSLARQYPRGVDHRLCCCGGPCRMSGQHYECDACQRMIPGCNGADDDEPDWCDDCWLEDWRNRARSPGQRAAEGHRGGYA